MFEDYIFSLDVDPDGMSDGDDPPISPTSSSACHNGRYSLAAAPARPAPASNVNGRLAENERIDRLAHELREQASISGRQARIQSSRILPEDRSESLTTRGCARMPHAAPRPVATSRTQPPSYNKGGKSSQASFQQRIEAHAQPVLLAGAGMAEFSPEATPSKRLWRQTDPRPQQQQHNHPCLENLLTDMVEHKVQCNVQQGSTTELPALTTRPSLLRISSPRTAAAPVSSATATATTTKTTSSGGLADFNYLMDLEVDTNYCEGTDENLLDDTIALRDAGAPTGVKKPGALRYRTSMDVGVQCRNLKRNVPRMRRRKPKTTKAYAPPAVLAGNTTATTMTMT